MSAQDKQYLMDLINAARERGARQHKACEIAGIHPKTFQRWQQATSLQDKRITNKNSPSSALSEFEKAQVLAVVNSPEYAHLSPSQVVPKLADKGIYLASESTMYRLLREYKQNKRRDGTKAASLKPKALAATGPNQVYSWDITYLPSAVKGYFYYLYMVMDVFSRKIVGWQVYDNQCSALAADLMVDICRREKIQAAQITLHSDNGGPMKGATLLATLQTLGVVPSFSRPSVSNDNPYSEALFKTMKYRPGIANQRFDGLIAARNWIEKFVTWYNNEHCHSGIQYVTPQQRHLKQDGEILEKRRMVYYAAKQQKPNRWSGNIRNWRREDEVVLNPNKKENVMAKKGAA